MFERVRIAQFTQRSVSVESFDVVGGGVGGGGGGVGGVGESSED